jgi:hypothetical protein
MKHARKEYKYMGLINKMLLSSTSKYTIQIDNSNAIDLEIHATSSKNICNKGIYTCEKMDIAVDELSTSLTAICLIASIPLGSLSALCVEELN